MNYLLGIDVGTSGTKALLINASKDGEVVASCTKTYPLYTPKPLWAEQEPEDWWQATILAIRQLIEDSGVEPKQITPSVLLASRTMTSGLGTRVAAVANLRASRAMFSALTRPSSV